MKALEPLSGPLPCPLPPTHLLLVVALTLGCSAALVGWDAWEDCISVISTFSGAVAQG